MNITCVIVDDEKLARDLLQEYIQQMPNLQVLGEASKGKDAVELIDKLKPDLVFLDVQMPGMTGFDVVDEITHDPHVIFCTAYEEYAIRAFKVNGVDYLLKPVQEEELKKAIDKVRSMKESKSFVPGDLQQLVNYFTNPSAVKQQYKERFIINSNNKWTPVETKDIAVFFKDNLNYIYTFSGDKLIYDFSALEDIEEVLDPNMFFRANRQAIIHINSIHSVKPYGNQKLMVQIKSPLKLEVDISREKAPLFKKWMDR